MRSLTAVNHLALAVVARRLADVDLVIDAVNHVEVIGAEPVPVNQRLWFAAGGVNRLNCPAGAFEPLLDLLPLTFITTSVFG